MVYFVDQNGNRLENRNIRENFGFTTKEDFGDSNCPKWLWWVLGGLTLIVVILLIVLVIRSSRKKKVTFGMGKSSQRFGYRY